MNKLELWEADVILSNIQYSYYNEWEMCRNQMYTLIQINSRKKIDAKKVLKLPWDEDFSKESEEHITTISNEDITKLKAKAAKIAETLNNE